MNDTVINHTANAITQATDLLVADSIPVKDKFNILATDIIPEIIEWGITAGLKLLTAIIIVSAGFWISKKRRQ